MSDADYRSWVVPVVEGTLQLCLGDGQTFFELRLASPDGVFLKSILMSPSSLELLGDQARTALSAASCRNSA